MSSHLADRYSRMHTSLSSGSEIARELIEPITDRLCLKPPTEASILLAALTGIQIGRRVHAEHVMVELALAGAAEYTTESLGMFENPHTDIVLTAAREAVKASDFQYVSVNFDAVQQGAKA